MTIKGTLLGKLEPTIATMGVGQQGYTVPWALTIRKVGMKYEIYLDTSFSIDKIPGGTVQLSVKRTGSGMGLDDYLVDLNTVGDYKFNLGKQAYLNYEESNLIKVGEIGMLEGLLMR